MPVDHEKWMEQISDVAAAWNPDNIYNQDGYGLLYRMHPNGSYITGSEIRPNVRGISFQKRMQRITTVYCVNESGSSRLPMKYIGKYKSPYFFKDHQNSAPHY